MANCIFCKIANGDVPVNFLYEGEQVVAFADQNPQAPHHYLIIPKKHIELVSDLDTGDESLLAELFSAAKKVAIEADIARDGYRLVVNKGRDGGQEVFHLHLHLLGGRRMTWPPG